MDDIRISQGSPPSTAQTYEQFQERRVFRALDGFRFISIVAVVWHHTQSSPHLQPILGRGFLGVDMFFTLSGFLIVTLLLRERERNGSNPARATTPGVVSRPRILWTNQKTLFRFHRLRRALSAR